MVSLEFSHKEIFVSISNAFNSVLLNSSYFGRNLCDLFFRFFTNFKSKNPINFHLILKLEGFSMVYFR
ncbi:unnamed protein product [Moneuplotes crassus]|uniref:Uncharacterized protein n=1 Tax=Euplotes crassus TaxID=5936 RepID=A0AAD1XB90_EUPCR|nr:unnamed protein product [Moneuplotes crassus]